MREPTKTGVRGVAAACGVSFSTAAAALRGDSWVKTETRRRIESAAERIGYLRDPAASILASRRKHGRNDFYSIVYLSAMFGIPSPGIFKDRLKSLQDMVRRRGFQFERAELRTAGDVLSNARRWIATGVDGIVLGPVNPGPFFECFPAREFSLVADSLDLAPFGVDVVRANHFLATERLAGELRALGYRRIGVIQRIHNPPHPDDRSRYGALCAFRDLVAADVECLEILRWRFRRQMSPEAQAASESRELACFIRKHRPDVLVGWDDGEMRLLRGLPKALSQKVNYAAMIVRKPFTGRIAGIQYDQEVVAEALLDRLVENIKGRRRGLTGQPKETLVELPWIFGSSLGRGSG